MTPEQEAIQERDRAAMRQQGIDPDKPAYPSLPVKNCQDMFARTPAIPEATREATPDLLTNIGKIPTILEAFEKLLIRAATNQQTGNVRMMVKFKHGCPKTYQEAEDFPTVTDHDLTEDP
jgi:hypothetical protein